MKDTEVTKAFNKAEKKKLAAFAASMFNAFYREGEDQYNPGKELKLEDLMDELSSALAELGVLPVKTYKVNVHRKVVKSGTLSVEAFDKKDAMASAMDFIVENDADEDLEDTHMSYEEPEIAGVEEE